MSESVVHELARDDEQLWTNFVKEHPHANLYHTLLWRDVIQEVFGHRCFYHIAKKNGEVAGVLPLVLVQFPFLGSKLLSLPYDIGSGGVLALDVESERVLVARAKKLAISMKVDYLQLRYGSARPALADLGFQMSEPVVISEMDLSNEQTVYAGISKDHRKAIRKAENRGVSIREAHSLQDFQKFYGVYVRVFRDFGTPPYGPSYFPVLWRRLLPSGAVRILLAEVQGSCIGGLLLFCWGKTLVSKFAVCLPEFVGFRTYVLLYWRAIQWGLEQGYTRLSWGTSAPSQAGLIAFKEGWGAKSHCTVFYNLPIQSSVPPIEHYYDSEGFARRAWKILPIGITRVVGGTLNKWFC